MQGPAVRTIQTTGVLFDQTLDMRGRLLAISASTPAKYMKATFCHFVRLLGSLSALTGFIHKHRCHSTTASSSALDCFPTALSTAGLSTDNITLITINEPALECLPWHYVGQRTSYQQFRKRGYAMVDWICNYYATVGGMPVRSQVQPGYLAPQMPAEAPEEGESFDAIMRDVDEKLMPGAWEDSRGL